MDDSDADDCISESASQYNDITCNDSILYDPKDNRRDLLDGSASERPSAVYTKKGMKPSQNNY